MSTAFYFHSSGVACWLIVYTGLWAACKCEYMGLIQPYKISLYSKILIWTNSTMKIYFTMYFFFLCHSLVCPSDPSLETQVIFYLVCFFHQNCSIGCEYHNSTTRYNNFCFGFYFAYLCHSGEIKRSTSMSFVDGNLGTWPKEKRLAILQSCSHPAHLKYPIPNPQITF